MARSVTSPSVAYSSYIGWVILVGKSKSSVEDLTAIILTVALEDTFVW